MAFETPAGSPSSGNLHCLYARLFIYLLSKSWHGGSCLGLSIPIHAVVYHEMLGSVNDPTGEALTPELSPVDWNNLSGHLSSGDDLRRPLQSG